MSSKIQGLIGKFEQLKKGALEPPVKKGKPADELEELDPAQVALVVKEGKPADELEELDPAQVALASMVAKLVKKDLGEMIEAKVGSGLKVMQDHIQDLAVATSEGFKEVEDTMQNENLEMQKWRMGFGDVTKKPSGAAEDGMSYFESGNKVCYVTDVEGHWEYFVNFVEQCNGVSFTTPGDHRKATADFDLELHDKWSFVFGGDSCDKGPGTIRFLKCMNQLKKKYPTRVFLLLGNRDVNKMRLTSELHQAEIDRLADVPAGYWVSERMRLSAKEYVTRIAAAAESVDAENVTADMLCKHNTKKNRLCYFFKHDMGSDGEFEFRRQELALLADRQPEKVTDEEVMSSFEECIAPGGIMSQYLENSQLGVILDGTLFVHGQIIGNQFTHCEQPTCWSIGRVPDKKEFIPDVRKWLVMLNAWAKQQIDDWKAQPTWKKPPTSSSVDEWDHRGGAGLIAYGTPATPTPSVVYCRYLNDRSMPIQYPQRLVEHLVLNKVHRVVVGHTPHGNAPTVIQHVGLTLVMADTSFSGMNCSPSVKAYSGDQRGDAVCAVIIKPDKNCVHVSGKLAKPGDPSQTQRVVDYEVIPLGHMPSPGATPDIFVGRQDGQIEPQADDPVFFVKARLPEIPGAEGAKYLLCNVDGFKVQYKEVNREDVELLTSASVGGLDLVASKNDLDSTQNLGEKPLDAMKLMRLRSREQTAELAFGFDALEADALVDSFFNEIDVDRDGFITAKELHSACAKKTVRALLRSQFLGLDIEAIAKVLDTNADGSITKEEFAYHMTVLKRR